MGHRLAAVTVVALAGGGAARADIVTGSARGADLELGRPAVRATLRDGMVTYRVRYDVTNTTAVADDAHLQLELPASGQVTALRQRIGLDWIGGRLLATEAAQARYSAYVDRPFVAPRGAALITGSGAFYDLALSFVPAHGRIGIEYEVVAPACYLDGRWVARYPADVDAATFAVAGGRVLDDRAVDALWAQDLATRCEPFDHGGSSEQATVLAWDVGAAVGVQAQLTTLTVEGTTVSALDVRVERQLAAVPRRSSVAFVIDASRSMRDRGVADQVAVIRGYLAHVPDAKVEIVVVRRHAARLFGTWLPAPAALARLAALAPTALTTGNGSNLDAGLALAAAILGDAPGPRRLVAFTDDRLRQDLDDATLSAALTGLPPDAVVHAVLPGVDGVVADREHHLTPVIAPWGGIVAQAGATGDPSAVLELVRPTRIEDLRFGEQSIAYELGAGDGTRLVTVEPPAPITGWIWGRQLTVTRRDTLPDRIRAARLALVAITDLDEPTARSLGALAAVVTPYASLLADRASWTPGGLPEDELGLTLTGSSGSMCGLPYSVGHLGTIGHGGSTGTGTIVERPAIDPLLAAPIAGCAATLGPAPWSVTIAIDTTGDEVVDVDAEVTGVADPAQAARLGACAVEAGWDLALPDTFTRLGGIYRATFTAR